MSRALEFLRAAQNADGGWGYKLGGMSFVEPTAAATLVLSLDAPSNSQVQRARTLLKTLQRADGGWGIAAPDDESGWMTAWAVLALAPGDANDMDAAARGVNWLLNTAGIRVTDAKSVQGVEAVLRIDPRITGWPWQPGDAAWIFPSSIALLALHAMKVQDHPRVREGIQYLLDRAIETGGWNIGNPFMLTGIMPPTVEATALALIALHTYGIESAETQRAQTVLAQENFTNTAHEWAWRAWYWKTTGAPVERARTALAPLQRADGSWDGNTLTTAVAMLGMGIDV
jgi:squalene cyclase